MAGEKKENGRVNPCRIPWPIPCFVESADVIPCDTLCDTLVDPEIDI